MNTESAKSSLEQNLKSRSAWMRLLYMLLFGVILCLLGMVLAAVAIVQFLIFLLTREPNPNLRQFGQGMATYTYDVIQFLCFNADEYPFPFAPWPQHPLHPQSEAPAHDPTDEQSGV